MIQESLSLRKQAIRTYWAAQEEEAAKQRLREKDDTPLTRAAFLKTWGMDPDKVCGREVWSDDLRLWREWLAHGDWRVWLICNRCGEGGWSRMVVTNLRELGTLLSLGEQHGTIYQILGHHCPDPKLATPADPVIDFAAQLIDAIRAAVHDYLNERSPDEPSRQ